MKKVDAPSGTAIKTAALIAESRNRVPEAIEEKEILTGARGARANEVRFIQFDSQEKLLIRK